MIAATLAPGFSGLARRDMRLALVVLLALFIGYVSQVGLPGSVVTLAILALATVLVKEQFAQGWTPVTRGATAVNAVAALAVLLKTPCDFLGEIRVIRAVRNHNRSHPRLMTLANILLPLLAVGIFGGLLITAKPLIEFAVLQISRENVLNIFLTWMPLVSVAAFFLLRSILVMRPTAHADALVVFALQPGSRSEASCAVRWLVYLWTAQNLLRVVSFAKHTVRTNAFLLPPMCESGIVIPWRKKKSSPARATQSCA